MEGSEGERILEYALAYDLFLGNTCFKKRDSHLITYRSGNTATQIDFMLFQKSLRKLVMDVKVIPGEEVALQHQLLVCDMMIDMPPQIKRKFTPRPKVWKLRDPQTCSRFQEVFKAHVPPVETEAATSTEEIWAKLKTGLLKTTEEVCGTTKPHRWRRETWWWNKEVDDAITAKRQAFKAWKAGKCTRASYNTAKRISRRVVHHARHEADKVVYEGIDHKSSDIFRLANQMRKENVDVVGEKPVKNDTGDALDRGNYRGLKLTEQAMKILERIVDGLIRQVVSIDDSQFGFVPGRGTTDAIFVVRQLQEKYLAVNKRLYMAFVDLEKAFDRVPRKVIRWALRKLGVEEWIVRLVQGMYANARSRVRVGEGFSKEFEVKVGVHQGSVLSPLLFIIVLEALSREFRAGVPWEDLYADDLVIIADSLEECVRRLLIWKEAMEKKELRVNAGKTKVMICGTGLDLLQSSGEYPCAVCRTGVGNNSIYCNGCKLWVHKKCSGLQRLTPNPDYRCARCMGNARPIDGRPQSEVQVGPDKLEVVASFCYLGDMLSAGGGCEMAVTTRVKTAWKKFRELLPVLTSRHLSFKTRGHVYSSCVRSAMLHASETWPLTKTNLQRLQRNDRAMIRQICSIKPEDVARVRSSELLAKLQLEDLDLILRERRLRWFGHVARSSGAIRTAYDMQIDGKRGAGRPKQTWKKLTEKDCREWKLTTVDPQERSTWRSGVRSAMRAASQLPGKGPTDVDDAPAPAC